MRGRSRSVLTREVIERIGMELGTTTDEAYEVYTYVTETLLEPPPTGISLPLEWVDQFMRATGQLARLTDRVQEESSTWLEMVKEFEARIRKRWPTGAV